MATIVGILFVVGVIGFWTERRHGHRLALEIQQRTQELRSLESERIKIDRLESLGLLAGGIAHDFNNLLMTIAGNIGILKKHTASPTEEREILQDMQTGTDRARDLSMQLLTFARGGAPVLETASVASIVMEATVFALRGSKVDYTSAISKDLRPVNVDVGQMNQVISNLLINAVQAMPEGGTIHLRGFNLAKDGIDFVVIEVEDEGPGIAKDCIDHIFDPYFSTKEGGSGLGLATAHSIINRHIGELLVEGGGNGRGAMFKIILPAAGEKLVANPIERPPTTSDYKLPHCILVVDDDTTVRRVIRRILLREGCTVLQASHGEEALSIYQESLESGELIDAVIADLTIPGGMGGKELAQHLGAIKKDLPIIVSSGYSKDDAMSNYKAHGFSARLRKPFLPDELLAILQSVT